MLKIKVDLKDVDNIFLLTSRDLGQDCDCVAYGATKEELLKNTEKYAVIDYGFKQEDIIMSPEMQQNIGSDHTYVEFNLL